MDDVTRAHYELKFEDAFLKAKGEAFQTFFADLMGKAHPSDFMPCRPWGRIGDRKNDGYLPSERTLFQVYAPNEMAATVAIAKIEEDLSGALPHWKDHFDKWVFVHNAHDGLPPHVISKLAELKKQHPELQIEAWSLEELRRRLQRIPLDGLQAMFGFAPTDAAKRNLAVAELEKVLHHISQNHVPTDEAPRPVPAKKIEANGLSNNVRTLLKAGMEKVEIVERFFDRWHEPQFGDRMAAQFRSKYVELREKGLAPDTIFDELHNWAGGTWASSAGLQVALLVVLAFFFEQCEIFERPREGEPA